MTDISPEIHRKVMQLLRRGTKVLGLKLCFHDWSRRSGVSVHWRRHYMPPCMAYRKKFPAECILFDVNKVHRELPNLPEGRVHRCPAGFHEIVVPVLTNSSVMGILYAGPCWTSKKTPPYPGLVCQSMAWMRERQVVVHALAGELGRILEPEVAAEYSERHLKILSFIDQHIGDPIGLDDLAAELHLSPSRVSHLVKTLFGINITTLVNQVKLRRAAYLLQHNDMSISQIAYSIGIEDQNYFSRIFSKFYKMSPREFRRRNPVAM